MRPPNQGNQRSKRADGHLQSATVPVRRRHGWDWCQALEGMWEAREAWRGTSAKAKEGSKGKRMHVGMATACKTGWPRLALEPATLPDLPSPRTNQIHPIDQAQHTNDMDRPRNCILPVCVASSGLLSLLDMAMTDLPPVGSSEIRHRRLASVRGRSHRRKWLGAASAMSTCTVCVRAATFYR